MEDIREMKRNRFLSLIDTSMEKKSLEYLHSKRGKKGQKVERHEIKMTEYLKPYGKILTISEKKIFFQ